jgi:acetyl-CoA carboxylase carboxyltransferase component
MNSKGLGADHVLAWPSAQIGIMGAPQAAGLLHRKEIAAEDDPEAAKMRLAHEYAAEHMTAEKLAEIGWVDEIVEPAETRNCLATVLHGLAGGSP